VTRFEESAAMLTRSVDFEAIYAETHRAGVVLQMARP
jgi:hypothetical protein